MFVYDCGPQEGVDREDEQIDILVLHSGSAITGLRKDDTIPAGVEQYEVEDIGNGQRALSVRLPDWILDTNWQPAKPQPKPESQTVSA